MFRITVRRGLTAGAAAVAAVALGAAPAMAHHCFIPMYSLQAPTSSNWAVFTAEMGAELEAGYVTECDAAREAGYDALEAAGLPVGIKIFAKMTIADPHETWRMAPNGANGKGLEYFGAGSELPYQMVGTYIAGASQVDCS